MLYDTEIDKTITKELYNNKSQSYNELFKQVCKVYRKISKAVYDFHIQKLKKENILNSREGYEGKLKKSYYFLTTEAKQKYRLHILDHKTDKEKTEFNLANEKYRRLITYLFLIIEYRIYHLKNCLESDNLHGLTEKELDIHLHKCNIKRNDLFLDKNSANDVIKNDKREHITCLKTTTNVQVYKHEIFDKNGKMQSIAYSLNLPGFSVKEFKENLNLRGIEHTGFTNEEIEDSLNKLIDEKIFEPVIEYDGRPRYVIIDDGLNHFIKKLFFLTKHIQDKMYLVWTGIRRPTKDDIKWLELIIGIKNAQITLNEIREDRKRFRKNKKYLQQIKETIYNKEKKIEENIECYKKEYSNIIEKYAFPCNEMLEIVYPKHFQKALIS